MPITTRFAGCWMAEWTCLLVETIFDTLNAKAAFFAILRLFEERGIEPLRTKERREAQRAEGRLCRSWRR